MAFRYSPRIINENSIVIIDPYNPKCYGGSGSSSIFNLTDKSIEGTVEPGTIYDSQGWYFDGVDDDVYITDSRIGDLTTNYTVNFWIKVDGHVHTNSYFLSVGSNTSGDAIAFTMVSATLLVCYGNYPSTNSSTLLTIDKWHNICVTYDGSTVRYYKDGYQFNTSNLTDSISPATSNLWLGSLNGRANLRGPGYVSTVHVYNQPLTASEISQNYNTLKGRFGH